MSILTILLIILIPMTILLITILVFVVLKQTKKERRYKKISPLQNELNLDIIKKANTTLSRVKKITTDISKHEETYEELADIFNDLDEKMNKAKAKLNGLIVDVSKISSSEFRKTIESVEYDIVNIKETEKRFESASGYITQQDEFLSNEYVFYTKHLREAIAIYSLKRVALNRIASKIDLLNDKIKKIGDEFNIAKTAGDNKLAAKILRDYAKEVIHFIEVISKAPTIESYIYITIPRIVSKLTDLYKEKKKELSAPLGHINFRESLIGISKQFNIAKIQFKSLDVDNAIITIKKILKSVEMLKRSINYEIISRNYFIDNYESTISETKLSLQRFVSLKRQLKTIVGNGHVISSDISTLMNTTIVLSEEIDKFALTFRKTMKDKNIPYSAKLSRMKQLLQKVSIFVEKMNEVLQHLWTVNIETSIIKNKFRKSEAAINEILANTKKQNIKLSDNEMNNYSGLSDSINQLSNDIEKGIINKEIQSNVTKLMENSTTFYNVVNGKIQIAEIVVNLIKEFSPQRANKPRLNIVLNSAEKAYLDGNYAHALNMIVTELEQGGV